MIPDKSAFISYKTVTHIQVRMGSNLYLLVLGRGTAIIPLNGQCILLQNVLHMILWSPLYSLCAHVKQHGCGFIGESDEGILVYFPTFVSSVDMSKDCHLALNLLGDRLHLTLFNMPSLVASHRSTLWR
jgi:hypothetical protein